MIECERDDTGGQVKLAPCGMPLENAKTMHGTNVLTKLRADCLEKFGFPVDYQAMVPLPSPAEVLARVRGKVRNSVLAYCPKGIFLLTLGQVRPRALFLPKADGRRISNGRVNFFYGIPNGVPFLILLGDFRQGLDKKNKSATLQIMGL